jgi:hypothetical protein
VVLKRQEQRIGLKPGLVRGAERGEVAVGLAVGIGLETLERGEERGPLGDVEPAEIDGAAREGAQRGDFRIREQTGALQRHQVDQVGIAREGGETLVGRIAVAGRPERADLPVTDAGILEEAQDRIDRLIEDADALFAGQAGGMQQEPRMRAGRAK